MERNAVFQGTNGLNTELNMDGTSVLFKWVQIDGKLTSLITLPDLLLMVHCAYQFRSCYPMETDLLKALKSFKAR